MIRNLRLGAFELIAPIGDGGMARVYRGKHHRSGAAVAIKVFSGDSRRPAYVLSFRNEIEAVARLDHPAIVRVYDFGEVDDDAAEQSDGELTSGAPFIVMELASAGALERSNLPRSWPALAGLLLPLLEGLAHAHARGIIHRDIKPANVLVDDAARRRYFLSDFGLAHAEVDLDDTGRHASWSASGTPPFMAPEQFTGEWRDQGPWTDLYAFGCLAYTLTTGAPPFREQSLRELALAHLTQTPPRLAPRFEVPHAFEGWLYGLLAKFPGDRFELCADAHLALQQLDASRMVPAAPTSQTSSFFPTPHTTPIGTQPVIDASFASGDTVVSGPYPQPWSEKPGSTVPTQIEHEPPSLPPDWRGTPTSRRRAAIDPGLGIYGLRTIPLVDREGERDVLWRALAWVHAQHRPCAVVLTGPAGSGKTRLANWLCERAYEVGGATSLRVSHSREGGPHHGVLAMFARQFRCHELTGEELSSRVAGELSKLGDGDPALCDAVLDLLTLRDDPTPLIEGFEAGTEERDRVLMRLVSLCARHRPTVLLLDDVHYGLDALRLCRKLLEPQPGSWTGVPALVVLTVRSETLVTRPLEERELDALLQDPSAQRIELSELAAADQRELVRQMAGLSEALVDRVVARTGGNPLFAVQLVDDWVARDMLVPGEDGLELANDAEDVLPDDVQQLAADRIRHAMADFDDGQRRAIELCALLGPQIDESEWREVCTAAALTADPTLLVRLAKRGLLEPAFGTWRFAHGVIRESLERGAQTEGRDAQNHHIVADMLRRRSNQASAEHVERLAHHLVAAGALYEALGPLLRAARLWRVRGEFGRARAMLDRRRELLDRLNVPGPDPRRAEGELLAAGVCFDHVDYEMAETLASGVEHVAHQRGWPALWARAILQRGHIASRRGEWGDARVLYERALETLTTYGDRRGEFEARAGIADVQYFHGDRNLAGDAYHENMALALSLNDELGVAESRWGLGFVCMWQGRLEQAHGHFDAMRDILVRRGAASRLADAFNGLGEVARLGERYAEAESYYRESLRLNEVYGTAGGLANRINIAILHLLQGDLDAALDMLPTLISDATQRNHRAVLCGALPIALIAHARSESWAAWDLALDKLQQLLAESGFKDGDVALTLGLAAERTLAAGDERRAVKAKNLARAQWLALDRLDKAEALDE